MSKTDHLPVQVPELLGGCVLPEVHGGKGIRRIVDALEMMYCKLRVRSHVCAAPILPTDSWKGVPMDFPIDWFTQY